MFFCSFVKKGSKGKSKMEQVTADRLYSGKIMYKCILILTLEVSPKAYAIWRTCEKIKMALLCSGMCFITGLMLKSEWNVVWKKWCTCIHILCHSVRLSKNYTIKAMDHSQWCIFKTIVIKLKMKIVLSKSNQANDVWLNCNYNKVSSVDCYIL